MNLLKWLFGDPLEGKREIAWKTLESMQHDTQMDAHPRVTTVETAMKVALISLPLDADFSDHVMEVSDAYQSDLYDYVRNFLYTRIRAYKPSPQLTLSDGEILAFGMRVRFVSEDLMSSKVVRIVYEPPVLPHKITLHPDD